MTNEMKLLRAFIEASGFDVEQTEIITLDGTPLPKPDMRPGAFIPIEADDIRNIIRVTDYKVTKKRFSVPSLTDDEIDALLDPSKSVNGFIVRIDNET